MGKPPFFFGELTHPLQGIPREKIEEILIGAGRKHAEDFAASKERIPKLIAQVDPVLLLSSLVHYCLTVAVDHTGQIKRPKEQQLHQAHVELVQALCLQVPLDKHADAPALPAPMQEIIDAVEAWTNQFAWKRLVQLENAPDDVTRRRLQTQEHIRFATQALRNWGYLDQVKRIALDMLAPLDERWNAVHQFKATDLIHIFSWMIEESGRRRQSHFDKLRPVGTGSTMEEVLTNYFKAFPDLKGTPEEMKKLLRSRGTSVQDAKYLMMSHADMKLSDCFTFDPDTMVVATGVRLEAVANIFSALSLKFGTLAGSDSGYFFLGNPIWTKPIIDLGLGHFFCPLPQLFFSFFFETIGELAEKSGSLKKAYDKRRSDYLEARVAEVLPTAFPGSTTVRNFKWKSPDGTQAFESDAICLVDSFLLLIEAKSGQVSPSSRRGAPERLGDDIDRLLVEPSRQSTRLEQAIRSAQRGDAGAESFRKAFPFDLGLIHRVIRVSITLEDVGFLQTNLNGLKSSGYVPPELTAAPAMTLEDFEVVLALLQSVPHRLHYLIRRTELEGRLDYMGDEMDLLGLYLETGLNLGDVEFKESSLVLTGMSQKIDDYHEMSIQGFEIERPIHKMTKWWTDILKRLEEKKPPRWTECSVGLLCAGIEEEKTLERRLRGLVADVRKSREKAASRNVILFSPAVGRGDAIAVLALLADQMSERHTYMQNAVSHALALPAVERCVVLAVDADSPHYPYSSLGAYFA